MGKEAWILIIMQPVSFSIHVRSFLYFYVSPLTQCSIPNIAFFTPYNNKIMLRWAVENLKSSFSPHSHHEWGPYIQSYNCDGNMEAGMYAQQPTIGEGKWQNQEVPHQVFQLVLLILHYSCKIPLKITKQKLLLNSKKVNTQKNKARWHIKHTCIYWWITMIK